MTTRNVVIMHNVLTGTRAKMHKMGKTWSFSAILQMQQVLQAHVVQQRGREESLA
jgi:hypothetical protein